MALATRCPRCHTTFRVVEDQLKLYSGIVRCGVCQQVFNGTDHLTREEKVPTPVSTAGMPAAENPVPPAPSTASAVEETPKSGNEPKDWPAEEIGLTPAEPLKEEIPELDLIEDFSPTLRTRREDDDGFDAAALEQAEGLPAAIPEEELPIISLDLNEEKPEKANPVDHEIELTPPAESKPSSGDIAQSDEEPFSLEEADTLLSKPEPVELPPYNQHAIDAYLTRTEPSLDLQASKEAVAADGVEPGFVRKARGRQRSRRISRILYALGSLILLVTLTLQGIYAFHDRILASMPAAEPVVSEMCAMLACERPVAANIDDLAIESVELQALPSRPETYMFEIVLRNRATSSQTWPHLELALSDESGQPTVRRVLPPAEYLAETPQAAALEKGFPAESELAIKLAFSLEKTKPAGYRAYIFYP